MHRHPAAPIARGSHSNPDDGMCVMELASQMAGERFTDRPRCVDPVIAAYLRTFNDRIGHAARQRLAPYAARSVRTRDSRQLTSARRDLCLEFAGARGMRGGAWTRWMRRLAARLRIACFIGLRPAIALDEGAGELAARAAVGARDVPAGFGLLDALLAEGGAPPARPASGREDRERRRDLVPA